MEYGEVTEEALQTHSLYDDICGPRYVDEECINFGTQNSTDPDLRCRFQTEKNFNMENNEMQHDGVDVLALHNQQIFSATRVVEYLQPSIAVKVEPSDRGDNEMQVESAHNVWDKQILPSGSIEGSFLPSDCVVKTEPPDGSTDDTDENLFGGDRRCEVLGELTSSTTCRVTDVNSKLHHPQTMLTSAKTEGQLSNFNEAQNRTPASERHGMIQDSHFPQNSCVKTEPRENSIDRNDGLTDTGYSNLDSSISPASATSVQVHTGNPKDNHPPDIAVKTEHLESDSPNDKEKAGRNRGRESVSIDQDIFPFPSGLWDTETEISQTTLVKIEPLSADSVELLHLDLNQWTDSLIVNYMVDDADTKSPLIQERSEIPGALNSHGEQMYSLSSSGEADVTFSETINQAEKIYPFVSKSNTCIADNVNPTKGANIDVDSDTSDTSTEFEIDKIASTNDNEVGALKVKTEQFISEERETTCVTSINVAESFAEQGQIVEEICCDTNYKIPGNQAVSGPGKSTSESPVNKNGKRLRTTLDDDPITDLNANKKKRRLEGKGAVHQEDDDSLIITGSWYEIPEFQPVVKLEKLPSLVNADPVHLDSYNQNWNKSSTHSQEAWHYDNETSSMGGNSFSDETSQSSVLTFESDVNGQPENRRGSTVQGSGGTASPSADSVTCDVCYKIFKHPNYLQRHKKFVHGGVKPHKCDVCGKRFTHPSSLKMHMYTHTDEKPYKCDICGKRLRQLSNLRTHQLSHNIGVKPYSCDICDKKFKYSTSIKKHMSLHTGDRPFACKICNKRFFQNSDLQSHLFKHTGLKPYKCDLCSKAYNLESNLKRHKASHTDEKPYTCNICNKSYRLLACLQRHVFIHTGEKPHSCKICQKSFSHLSGLRNHQLVHTGKKPFKCKICDKAFSTRSKVIRHNVSHTGARPYKCDICDKVFSLIGNMRAHKLTHSSEKPFSCEICNKSFVKATYLTSHQLVHTDVKPYICTVCDKAFAKSSYLTGHMMIHTGERRFPCTVCDKAFRSGTELRGHMTIHTGEKPFACEFCNKAFPRTKSLRNHLRIHTGEKPYQCNFCDKTFAYVSSLKSHRFTHTGEKRYSCDVCDKLFSRWGDFKRHKLIHEKVDKTYACDICNKVFAQAKYLQKHQQIHSGEKPYICDICDKAFLQASYLRSHQYVHTGKKPHSCSVCGKGFVREAVLRKHMSKHTGEDDFSTENS